MEGFICGFFVDFLRRPDLASAQGSPGSEPSSGSTAHLCGCPEIQVRTSRKKYNGAP
ncbi:MULTISPECIES: hypothetical protein [unclassified Methanosarcina]|uniref:hypothetical protein n=1 Tax=unclassified Methanosarcina TaxID=2644672 RepID=UPI0025DAA039|nr:MULTISPECIES: hypothetical protein [unclassified Methanosarcina]